jgi:hypothetical protein
VAEVLACATATPPARASAVINAGIFMCVLLAKVVTHQTHSPVRRVSDKLARPRRFSRY